MNIWLLTGEYPPDYGGGIATYCYHTAQMLCQRGHHLTVFAASETLPGGWQIEEHSSQLRVVRFGADQRPASSALGAFARWSYDAAVVLAQFCRQEGAPEALEMQEYLGLPYFFLQRRWLLEEAFKDVPVLVTAHTSLYLCHQYDRVPAFHFPGYWIGEMERFSVLAADRVVFPSAYLRDEVEKDSPQIRERSQVIPSPYRVEDEAGFGDENLERRGFLFAAKLERRKGIEPLLATFSRLWEAGLKEPLYILGDDWYDELHQRKMSEGIQQRYGKYIEADLLCWEEKQTPQAVEQKMSQVRATILPSLFENYPYAVLEAMALGCPAIVSENGGHAEVIQDGVSGYIFSHQQAGDLEAKIQAVLRLTRDEHALMGAAAQARARQISSYEVVAPQKEEVLERLRYSKRQCRHFPFLRGKQRDYVTPEDPALVGEPGLLSVVIPFHNLGDYLEDTLKPFEDLKDLPFEIIVMDDGSNDPASLEKLESLQARYKFHLERTKKKGLAAARNEGAHLARGEFLAFIDADDYMDASRLYPQAIAILRQYDNVHFVGCWMEYFGEAEGYWQTWNPEPPYALVHNPINTGALVYRRADFLRYGLNDPAFEYMMEDYDSLLSMLENGCRGVAIPETYQKYRVRSASMYHNAADSVKYWTYQQLALKHRALYAEYADEVFGIININGPSILYDNPTLWYPPAGFPTQSSPPSNAVPALSDTSFAAARRFLYLALRAVLFKPYWKLAQKFPWLDKLRRRLIS